MKHAVERVAIDDAAAAFDDEIVGDIEIAGQTCLFAGPCKSEGHRHGRQEDDGVQSAVGDTLRMGAVSVFALITALRSVQ